MQKISAHPTLEAWLDGVTAVVSLVCVVFMAATALAGDPWWLPELLTAVALAYALREPVGRLWHRVVGPPERRRHLA